MGNLEIGGEDFTKRTKEANEITQKLKQLEQSYGQYGRNVGNYANGVAEGMQKIKVAVGDTTREYGSYREAVKSLTQERFNLSKTLGTESEQYKQIDKALKQLQSDYGDLNRSSKFMDGLLDTVQSFTSFASIGVGLSRLFDVDDADFNDTMQKFASLTLVMQGIEKLQLQIQKREGVFSGFFANIGDSVKKMFNAFTQSIDDAGIKLEEFIVKKTKANKELEREGFKFQGYDKASGRYKWSGEKDDSIFSKENEEYLQSLIFKLDEFTDKVGVIRKGVSALATGFKVLGKAIGAAFSFIGGYMALQAISAALDFVTDLIKSFKTTQKAAEQAAESLNAVNRQLQTQREILGSQYLKGAIKDEEYLNGIYKAQAAALEKQIDLIQKRAQALQKNASLWNMFDATQNTEFSVNRVSNGGTNIYTNGRVEGATTVGHGRLTSALSVGNDLQITVKNIEELEKAWRQCNEAISENKDYFDKWSTGLKGWWNSLWATVKDTQEVMRGLGNTRLGDLVARFDEINKKYEGGAKEADKYAAELAKLRKEMNNNEILNSVIANLDKYIPDDKVREAVQNIINEIYRLDDAFNMVSQEQIHYWRNVEIEGMKEGLAKQKAQIAENERYELATVAKTAEQQKLIRAKYARQRKNAEEKDAKDRLSKAKEYGKKLVDAENELIALRIENMKDGLDKELALIENERRLAIQKARENGTKSGQIIMEINLKYDKKVLDKKRQWAAEIIKIYEDLLARIEQVNKSTFEKEVDTATRNIEMKQAESLRRLGYETITPSNYDDTKNLEAYYKKVMDIEKKYLDIQTQIQQESLDKQLDYTKAEEELRHRRATDPNDNEFLQQLKAGKITQEQYDKLIEDENIAHAAKMNAIDKEYASNSKKITEDNLKETQELYSTYYDKIIDGVRQDKAKIDEIASKPPVLDKEGWNVINLKATRANYKEALKQYDELKEGIIEKQRQLKKALREEEITAEDFAIKQKELDDEMKAIDEASKGIKQSMGELFGQFWQSLNVYIQQVGQAANQIIQSIGQIAEAAFEKEIEAIDKQNELLEKKLEKQKEITEKYADKVNDIEDELSDARGSRRQYLIDSLNAQMEAQRRSLEQEKAIEKQQEALAKKKERLEEEEKKRKKSQAITTAVINAALAISNAAVNNYPIPAIPMIALATAVGAAQVAAVKAAKYEQGGLLKGKSHKEGGIKALGGTVELEGQEFVINKKTTMQNLPLLDYINSKKKRIDLNELIDFYQGGTKKAVGNIQRNYFENGGQLPTVRTDVELQGTIYRAMEEYSKKPTYVSVVEILDKAESVQSVKTLAGL